MICVAAVSAQSNIAINPGGPVHLNFNGSTGTVFSVEASDSLAPVPTWKPALKLMLTNQAEVWCSPDAALRAARFYRLTTLATLPPNPAFNFRLIDQTGVSHELFYHLYDPTVSTIVVFLTQNGWQDLQPFVPALAKLQSDFQNQKILFGSWSPTHPRHVRIWCKKPRPRVLIGRFCTIVRNWSYGAIKWERCRKSSLSTHPT